MISIEDKENVNISILGLGLGLLLVGYLLGLRRSNIWGFTLGSLSAFSLTGVFKGGYQGFHRSFRHWGWLLGGGGGSEPESGWMSGS